MITPSNKFCRKGGVHIPWYAALNEPCGGVVTLEVIFGKTLDARGRLFASDITKSIFVEIIS